MFTLPSLANRAFLSSCWGCGAFAAVAVDANPPIITPAAANPERFRKSLREILLLIVLGFYLVYSFSSKSSLPTLKLIIKIEKLRIVAEKLVQYIPVGYQIGKDG
jgi:hypothetical protein